MPANGLELLMQLMGGTGGNLRDVLLGMAIPQLPKIAKQLTLSDQLPQAPGSAPMGMAEGGGMPPGIAPGVPPQLLPLLALAARAQGGGLPMQPPPAPRALPRLTPMDQAS
jgi:hypothetical protein